MLKAQLSFCSKLPRDVIDNAQMNSRKSMVPSPFLSKVLKACCANFDASPYGKNCKCGKSSVLIIDHGFTKAVAAPVKESFLVIKCVETTLRHVQKRVFGEQCVELTQTLT